MNITNLLSNKTIQEALQNFYHSLKMKNMKNTSCFYRRSFLYVSKYFIIGLLLMYPWILFCQVNTWLQRNDIGTSIKNGPPYRFQHSTFWFSIGNKGYVGIISDTSDVTFLFEYDPATNNWAQKAGLPGKVRQHCIGFSIGSKGYVGTGWTASSNYNGVTDFWEFDPINNTWTRKADLPLGLAYASGFSIGDKGYIGLGYKTGGNSNQFWQYDPINNTWIRKADFPGLFRTDQVGFSLNNEGYMGLGYHVIYSNGANQTIFDNDIWAYDPNTDTWAQKPDYPGVNRYSRLGIGYKGKAYIGTGEQVQNQVTTNEFWEFDPVANVWNKKKDFFDDSRSGAAAFVLGDHLHVGFGQGRFADASLSTSSGVGLMEDLWKYDVANDSWSEKRALQYDVARCSFKIADKGYALLPKYNYQLSKPMLALFAFDTAAKTWERKADFPSTNILWSMGSFTIANKGYVVCGANSDFTVAYKNLYEYDPALDKWTRKADFEGDARRNICAFSINGKGYAGLGFGVIVVSGLPSVYKVNDFWEYDPQLNSWTRKEDIPNSSNEVSCFSTISKGYVINTGMELFEFDPALNQWTQKNNFPGSPRTSALGTSIGNTGYVFGGTDNIPVLGAYVYLKDMWVYNSVNDTWTTNSDFPGHERSTKIGFTIGNKIFIGAGFNQTLFLHDWWEYQLNPDEALPITLVKFTAAIANYEILLSWQTANEVNTAEFIVERSSNGLDFTVINSLKASGTSSSTKNYSYTDQQPSKGINFYRLKIFDVDGRFTYSRIIAIKIEGKNNPLLIFPNPAKDILNVQINGENENAILQIQDITGRNIKEEKINLTGNTAISVDINNLPNGVYNLLVKGKSINEHQKFVKQ